MLKPLGTMVLIKAKKLEKVSAGGIILHEDTVEKEQAGEQTGEVVAIGPCAYVGWKGCESPDSTPHSQWGIVVGDIVEHRRYNAMNSTTNEEDGDIYRYIPDIDILGVIEDE